ncbi:glycosyltransferase family 4 protein [Paenibacillus sp. F411]|uniref:Glycosyl transferase group 1 n=1 Tax=Paenibacillus algicola TaxID=2565926 RepID=A0A4P8XKE8_9BACL|nr:MULTISPECIES: glycosyltransferase family 4 protein [Paenibacillus]MBO2942944.1 glycosyltransferase family 4 protein [Paenibacillus sp. F411]QCT02855.1 glycosyl transferase group 1 [Paenibacillus algicola]
MRILLATMWLVPHVGGVWNFMQQLHDRLVMMGHQVDLLGNSPDYSSYYLVNQGRELPKELLLPMLRTKLNLVTAPIVNSESYLKYYEFERYSLELAAAFFGLDHYDIIHTQDIFAARALYRVKPKHIPLISQVHGSVAREMHEHFRKRPELQVANGSPTWNYYPEMEFQSAMSSDLTVTANQWSKNILVKEYGVASERIQVLPYGIETEAFYDKMARGTLIQRPPGKKVFIFPARLVPVKGIDVLLAALAIVARRRSDWVCWIVGDGELMASLQALTQQLGLQEYVIFHGARNDIPALLGQSDIFVHTCVQDNQPYSVMEAQLAGLPCVVSNAGGLPEMVQEGVTGLISQVGDAGAIAEQLILLLANDEYRQALGRNGQAYANEVWSMDRMMEQMIMTYHEVLARKI